MTRLSDDELALLKAVVLLAQVDDEALRNLAARARRRQWAQGERIVGELEAGADVFVVLRGEAEVSLQTGSGERELLGKLRPGSAFGEMSSVTGELRSATVTALEPVEALVIPDAAFDDLRTRRPQVAVALVETLAQRLADAERTIAALLDAAPHREGPAAVGVELRRGRGSISRAWRELVVAKKKDLAFLTFVAFVSTLLLVRALVYLSFRFDFAPRDVLRAAYTSGFALLGASSCAALLTFRPAWRRAIAVAYGIAIALIANELGVTLAFDIFYKDIDTPDPSTPFDIERLYRKTVAIRTVLVALAVLAQAAYLRPFWRRAAFVVRTRLRSLVARLFALG